MEDRAPGYPNRKREGRGAEETKPMQRGCLYFSAPKHLHERKISAEG